MIPEKLPEVTGRGGRARAFRILFAFCNQLRDHVASLTPRSPGSGHFSHRSTGTTYKSGGSGDSSQDDSTDARWA